MFTSKLCNLQGISQHCRVRTAALSQLRYNAIPRLSSTIISPSPTTPSSSLSCTFRNISTPPNRQLHTTSVVTEPIKSRTTTKRLTKKKREEMTAAEEAKAVEEEGGEETELVKQEDEATEEDLDPEMKALRPLVHKLQGGLAHRRYRRAQLINRKRIEATLENVDLSGYEGCQIIDMNPGFGIFSKLMHEKVKPSRHILLEPNPAFHPILYETLVENPPCPETNCVTTILADDGYEWETYESIIEREIFQPETVPPKEGVNKKILFIGNLAMKGNDGDRFMTQIMESIGSATWLQKYGRVRMMVWIPDSVKIRFLPRMMRDRTRVTVMSEICADITELAGGGYYDEATTWQGVIKTTLDNLVQGMAELDEKRRKGIVTTPPGAIVVERRPFGKGEEVDGNFQLTPEEQAEEDAIYEQKTEEALAENTRKKHKAAEGDKESFLGIHFRGELESLYAKPGHKPWTPELKHPPWVYDNFPELKLKRPAPRPVTILSSTVGRLKKDGTRTPPSPVKPPTKLFQPLVKKTLRRIPFPNEYILKNGYDAWQLMEAYHNQKQLDEQIAKWDEEANHPIEQLPEDDRIPEPKVTVREQYMLASQAKEMGYKWTTMAKAGLIWKSLEADFGTEEAYVWMRAIGQAPRKRALVEILKEEIVGSSILQWYKRKIEPVDTLRSDVQPKEPIAFLDIIPKDLPEWLSSEEISSKTKMDRWELLHYILRNVFVIRAATIRDSFATLAPGSEDVLQNVPSLAGEKGGEQRTRMLTAEQYIDLAQAFEVWPFRNKMAVWEDRLVGLEQATEADMTDTIKKYSENWA